MPRAWLLHSYNGYQSLRLENVPEDSPAEGEIRLRVEAFALNWGDMDLMWDRYSFSFPKFPARVGIEAAGVVDAVGPGVAGIIPGQRMCTLPYFYYNRGASTESLVIDARYATKAPPGLSPVECASVWMQYMTAYFPLAEVSRVGEGTNVLATAATGTAGSAALEIGRLLNARMIGTTRFIRNEEYLRRMGAEHVIVTGRDDLGERLGDVTGRRGVDVILDPVGASLIGQYCKALAKDARIFFYGTLDKRLPMLPIKDMFQANAVFHPYSVCNYVENDAHRQKGTRFVHKMLEEGKLKPRIDRVYPMEQYREAFDYLSQPRENHGKVVIETGL